MTSRLRGAVNGYGVIGKRVADAVRLQDDMVLVGVADVVTDYRVQTAAELGIPLYGGTEVAVADMREADLAPAGTLDNLIAESDIVVDCTPKEVASLTGLETDGARSIAKTDASLGIRRRFLRSSAPVGVAVGLV